MPDILHTVWDWGGYLGIVCKNCEHLAVLDDSKLPNMRDNMTLLRNLNLKCVACGASGKGATHWSMHLLADRQEAERFLTGFESYKRATL